jgi:hypothetical protein
MKVFYSVVAVGGEYAITKLHFRFEFESPESGSDTVADCGAEPTPIPNSVVRY